MTEENVNSIVERVDVVSSVERAQIDSQIATAQQYPKHQGKQLSKVKENMMSFATLDEETAASCFYTLPRGGKNIQGPGIRLAEIAVCCYGNIRNAARSLKVDADSDKPHVIVQAICHDLENNVAVSVEKRRRILPKKDYKTGQYKPIDDDDINLAVNSGIAIAFRDAAFKVIPLALVKPVYEKAKQVAIGDAKTLANKRAECIERLQKMGVPQENILATLECRKVEDIGLTELGILIGLGTAIKDGNTTIEDAFPFTLPDDTRKKGINGLKERIAKRGNRQTTEADEPDEERQKKIAEEKKKLENLPKPDPSIVEDDGKSEAEREAEQTAKDKFGTPEEVEKGRKKRKRRTKAEMEAAQQPEDKSIRIWTCSCGHKFDEARQTQVRGEIVNLCPKCLKRVSQENMNEEAI